MRKRRFDAKTRVAARACLAGEVGAIETCVILNGRLYQNPDILSIDDRTFLKSVVSETDHLPIGSLKDNWHPDFLPAKLRELEKYESQVAEETKLVCQRLLVTMEARKKEAKG